MTYQGRDISNERLPRPTPSFVGTKNKVTLLGQGTGELGQNVESHMDTECIDEWRDEHGIFRANALPPLPDFED